MVVPSGWLLVPDTSKSWPFSVALITSSIARVLMATTGAVRETSNSCVAVVLLPALSVRVAEIVCSPFASAPTSVAGTPTLQLPDASSMAV
ncbi:Uncharacterised protein [Enterobacter cloacae]|nr:Uncharacterised protein [Enterobacter cloacae]